MNKEKTTGAPLQGTVASGFEAVRKGVARNFSERGEVGAAVSIYHRGKPLVDLWGGYRDGRSRAPWEKDTLVLMYSATKGVAGLTMALAQARGLFDYEHRWRPTGRSSPSRAKSASRCANCSLIRRAGA